MGVYQTSTSVSFRLVLHCRIVLQFTTPYWLLWYLLACFFWLLLLPAFDKVQREHRLPVLGVVLLVALLVGLDPFYGGICLQPVPDGGLLPAFLWAITVCRNSCRSGGAPG